MTRRRADGPGFSPLNIARGVTLLALFALIVGTALERGTEAMRYPSPVSQGDAKLPPMSDAGVFRLGMDDFAVAPDFVVARPTHPRTLDFARRLRAYPGAPPRVPHGLTREEYERTSCNVCHQRGGWVARFGTYAPVTPHPEQASCLQCHLPQDELVGRPLPEPGSVVCTQCHVDPDRRPATFVGIDWRPAAWPQTELQAMAGSPHLIPHDVESRSNCLACHGGPGAVAELRTDHPDRSNCRQCHVPASGGPDDVFDRAETPSPAGSSGAERGGER